MDKPSADSIRLTYTLERPRALVSNLALILFAATMGLSAALLFAVQPMYAKMLLPLVGGAPTVWSAVVVFFQVALLVGYLLAHLLRSTFSLRAQVVTHIGLSAIALVMLPFAVKVTQAAALSNPVGFVLMTLFMGAGIPLLAISVTSPLLQNWYARLGQRHSSDPYFLYAASNAGSLIGLAVYPVLLEPFFGVSLQSRLWAWIYAAFVACLCGGGLFTWRFGTASPLAAHSDPVAHERITWSTRLRWIVLAFVPASLSLAVTTHITNEVAPIPLLWTLPLAIYLITFIIAFSRRPIVTPQRIARALPYAVLPIALLSLVGASLPDGVDIALNLIALFLIALTCHGQLSASRPHANNLTEFYVLLSFGGALGGFFNAIVAPNVFPTVAEYPLTIVLACALLPAFGRVSGSVTQRIADVAAPLLLGCVLLAVFRFVLPSHQLTPVMVIGFAIALVVCFSFVGRRIRFALGIAVLFIVANVLPNQVGYRLDARRNFFGTKLVERNPRGWHELAHSGTVHGIQDPARPRDPLAYYSHDGPLGTIFGVARNDGQRLHNVGIVGLGAGAAACYRQVGERWTFFEIDPQVVTIARDPKFFSYLSSCNPSARVIVGDGRLELAKVPPNTYDVLVLDAYSSDQPPVHLLTREAILLYARDVTTHGIIAFHISNRYFNLAPVLASLAAATHLIAWIGTDSRLTAARSARGEMGSQWVVMTRTQRDAGEIAKDSRWQRLLSDPKLRTWSDDYSSLLLVMRR